MPGAGGAALGGLGVLPRSRGHPEHSLEVHTGEVGEPAHLCPPWDQVGQLQCAVSLTAPTYEKFSPFTDTFKKRVSKNTFFVLVRVVDELW